MGYITDKTNRICIYRIGLILRLVVVLVMIFFGQDLVTLLPLAGFMYGLAEGFYYSSYNVLKQEMISRTEMSKFAILIMALSKVVEIVTPILLGVLIDSSSFAEAAICVGVVSFAILVISFFIKSQRPESSGFNMRGFLRKLKEKNEATDKIKLLYIAALFYGLTTVVTAMLNICIMLEFNTSVSLGWITSLIGVISVLEIMLISKFTVEGKRNWMYVVTMLLPIFASVLFVVYPCIATIVIFNVLMGVSGIIFKTIYDIYRNGNLKEAGLYGEIAEHQVVVECLLSIVRLIGFIIVMVVGLLQSEIVFKVLLVLVSLSYSGVLYCLYIYEKRYKKGS